MYQMSYNTSNVNMNATSIAAFIVNIQKDNTDLRNKVKTLEDENTELHIQIAEYHIESDTSSDSESVASNYYESESESESDFFVSYNSDLTDAFDKLASYEEDPHKRDAYRKAADAIYKLPFEVISGSELAEGPKKVPGIGKGIAKKIDEFLETGKIKRLEELRKGTSTNEEIAWHLEALASLEAESHGSQDPFKIRAYRRAAEIIRELDFEVTSGAEIAKGPKKIEGIGAGIGKKIDEFLQTGKMKRIEELSNP